MHNIHSGNDFCKDRVFAVEMWGGRMCDEPLCAFGVFAGGGHANAAGLVLALTEFRADGIVFAAEAVATITTGLYYEVGYYPVEELVVEITTVHKCHEVYHGAGGFFNKQLHDDIALRSFYEHALVFGNS